MSFFYLSDEFSLVSVIKILFYSEFTVILFIVALMKSSKIQLQCATPRNSSILLKLQENGVLGQPHHQKKVRLCH